MSGIVEQLCAFCIGCCVPFGFMFIGRVTAFELMGGGAQVKMMFVMSAIWIVISGLISTWVHNISIRRRRVKNDATSGNDQVGLQD